ncbi:hypothetical protein L484_006809 [Morus notabilis]|uniref:Ribosomal protein L2 C-terminal domain-containing protein n=1 Tax=Morus notabilis TaxID=981085 RepID=W9RP74_9ROSA|nr:hypothetical protein L484_006809 [Morus notabilis]
MEKTKLFQAPTEPEAPLVSKRGGRISSSTSRKPYALEEACTVWEGVLIDQKEESTSTDMPLGTAIHNIEITLGKGLEQQVRDFQVLLIRSQSPRARN